MGATEVAAVSAEYVDGEHVACLWDGEARRGAPWQESTLCWIAFVTKAVTALSAAMLADRDLLDVEAPVSSYSPQFGQAGKERLPVWMVLDHTTALPTFPNYGEVAGDPHAFTT